MRGYKRLVESEEEWMGKERWVKEWRELSESGMKEEWEMKRVKMGWREKKWGEKVVLENKSVEESGVSGVRKKAESGEIVGGKRGNER